VRLLFHLTKKRRPRLIERAGGIGRYQDFSEILKDLDIVVDDKNSPVIGSRDAHVTICGSGRAKAVNPLVSVLGLENI
jgi:hypothetical protein